MFYVSGIFSSFPKGEAPMVHDRSIDEPAPHQKFFKVQITVEDLYRKIPALSTPGLQSVRAL